VRFSGHVRHGHTLKPGRYVVTIVARTAGGLSSKAVKLAFKVAR
jgi:hypothetical protein